MRVFVCAVMMSLYKWIIYYLVDDDSHRHNATGRQPFAGVVRYGTASSDQHVIHQCLTNNVKRSDAFTNMYTAKLVSDTDSNIHHGRPNDYIRFVRTVRIFKCDLLFLATALRMVPKLKDYPFWSILSYCRRHDQLISQAPHDVVTCLCYVFSVITI